MIDLHKDINKKTHRKKEKSLANRNWKRQNKQTKKEPQRKI